MALGAVGRRDNPGPLCRAGCAFAATGQLRRLRGHRSHESRSCGASDRSDEGPRVASLPALLADGSPAALSGATLFTRLPAASDPGGPSASAPDPGMGVRHLLEGRGQLSTLGAVARALAGAGAAPQPVGLPPSAPVCLRLSSGQNHCRFRSVYRGCRACAHPWSHPHTGQRTASGGCQHPVRRFAAGRSYAPLASARVPCDSSLEL